MNVHFLKIIITFVLTLCSTQANAVIISELGGQVVYDTDRDITWIANANLAASNSFGLAYGTNLGAHPLDINTSSYTGIINANGSMNWSGALFWIDAMNSSEYLGYKDWRLPTALYPDGSGCGGFCTESELGHLFYQELGGSLNSGDSDLALFSNLTPSGFWSGTVSGQSTNHASRFTFKNGTQTDVFKSSNLFALAVRDGNVSTVPTPGSVWFFISALIGIFGFRNKSKISAFSA